MEIQEKMRKPMLEAISECGKYRQISPYHPAFLFKI